GLACTPTTPDPHECKRATGLERSDARIDEVGIHAKTLTRPTHQTRTESGRLSSRLGTGTASFTTCSKTTTPERTTRATPSHPRPGSIVQAPWAIRACAQLSRSPLSA